MNLPAIAPLPHITTLYAGLLALFYLTLASRVIWLRNVDRVGIGSGESRRLAKAVRAHGNAAEYLPFALLLMLLLELQAAEVWLLHGCGLALLLGRLLHAWGLSRHAGRSFGRFTGISITLLVLLTLALACLLRAWEGLAA